MEPKMKDIAREAGVSTATVGRVLHKTGYVSPEAKERVDAAVRKLGYVPNGLARALTTKRSGVIGCLVVENAGNLYQEINRQLLSAAERRGYKLLTMQTRVDVRDEDELLRQLIGLRVDGLAIVSNIYLRQEHFELLRLRQIPTVMIERAYDFPHVDNVRFRDLEGAEAATRKFLAQGHRRVAFLGPEPFDRVEEDRLSGFRRAMEAAGVPREAQLLCLTDTYGIDQGREGMERLLALPEPPTAVFCTADILAAGAMQALYRHGIRVPEEMSLSGYDNRVAQELAPPINSVEPDLPGVGEKTLELLLRRMEDPARPGVTEWVDMRYVDRGTIQSL